MGQWQQWGKILVGRRVQKAVIEHVILGLPGRGDQGCVEIEEMYELSEFCDGEQLQYPPKS